jgi:hypothetical protein
MSGKVSEWIERARAVRIEDEVHHRGIRLRRASATESVGPCPVCGGRDRFGINIRKQAFHCRNCDRGGGVVQLVQLLDRCDFDTAVGTLTRQDRPAPAAKPAEAVSSALVSGSEAHRETQEWAALLWREAVSIEGTPVERYLTGRGIDIPAGLSSRVLRFHPRCPFLDHAYDPPTRITVPAMIALFRSIASDDPVAIHRTALTLDGRKAPLENTKLTLGPVEGAAIKLSPDTEIASGLAIGEGIETTLAGIALGFAPAWALGSSGKIGRFPVLAGIESLTILVDHDDVAKAKRGAGQVQARECSARWTAAGREVFRVTPVQVGTDMNDLLQARRVA